MAAFMNSKDRLKSWSTRQVDGVDVTQEHLEVVSLATHLATRYDDASGGKKTSAEITRLALIALDSKDTKKLVAAKDWLSWLNHEIEDEDEAPLELSTIAIIKRKADELKQDSNKFGTSPSDLPKGWKGIDARVIDEGSGNVFKVAKGAQMKRSYGANMSGGIPKFDGPFLGAVHRTGGGGIYEIEGQFEDQAGVKLGGGEKDTVKTFALEQRGHARNNSASSSHESDDEDAVTVTTPPATPGSSASSNFPQIMPNSPNSISSFSMDSQSDKKRWYTRRK